MEIGMFFLPLTLKNARKLENWRNSFWWSANQKIRKNDFNKSSEIFSRKCRHFLGGPRTETKFVKWSASRKRLRTADIEYFGQLTNDNNGAMGIIGFCETRLCVFVCVTA